MPESLDAERESQSDNELYIVDLDRVTIFIWGSVIVFMISLGIKMYLS